MSRVFAICATFVNTEIDTRTETFSDHVSTASQVPIDEIFYPCILIHAFKELKHVIEVNCFSMFILDLKELFIQKVHRLVEGKVENSFFFGAVPTLGERGNAALLSNSNSLLGENALRGKFGAAFAVRFFSHQLFNAQFRMVEPFMVNPFLPDILESL